MFKLICKIGLVLILLTAVIVIFDSWMASSETSGLGYTLQTDQVLFCTTGSLRNVSTLRSGSELVFDIANANAAGSLTSDALPSPGATLKAKVLDVGVSKTMPGRKVALFAFTDLVVGSREIDFDGYISMNVDRPPDSTHSEARFLGGFIGMEGGAPAILAGTMIGGKAIDSYRRHTKAPISFVISSVPNDEIIPIRTYRPVYIPLDVKTGLKPDPPKWQQIIRSFSVAIRRRVVDPIRRQIG